MSLNVHDLNLTSPAFLLYFVRERMQDLETMVTCTPMTIGK